MQLSLSVFAIDRAMVDLMAPDAVIVATGARARWPRNIEIGDAAHVVDAWQVLRQEVNPGASVLIHDWRCDWVGLGVAEMLAEMEVRPTQAQSPVDERWA